MLPDILKSEKYYLDKLSMMLKLSWGVEQTFDMFITMLVLVDEALDSIMSVLDITKDETFIKIYEADANESDILDKLAHLYGVSRNFTMKYHDDDDIEHPDSVVTTSFSLNNFELWMLIKGQILQNQYDGTYKQTTDYYSRMQLPIIMRTSGSVSNNATCWIYLNKSATIEIGNYRFTITENIQKMFKAGLFTIKSLGIKYTHLTEQRGFLLFKEDQDVAVDMTHGWEKGVWDR